MRERATFKKSAAVSVLETLTSLIIVNLAGYERMTASFNVASHALDQFVIKGRNHADGTLMTLFSAAGDFTSPAGMVVDASGDLTTQAVGSGYVTLDVSGWERIEIQAASGNVGGSTVTTFICLN